jgi:hypothetical protein
MFLKRSVSNRSTAQNPLDSVDDHGHSVFVEKQRNDAIERLLGDGSFDVESDSELGYDPNDSAVRRLRY